ncbi:MAG TPA: AsmA family protein [Dongiaceae bacterium]
MRLRTILIAIVVVLVALVATAVGVLMSIDYNQYKPLIAAQVKAATGRDLSIGGNFKLGISLSPTLAVDNVSLSNMPGGTRPVMINLNKLEVQVELIPLLSRKIKVNRVILDGADILLETDKQGKGNWVFEVPGANTTAATTTTITAPAPAEGGGMALPEVDTVQIRNSTVTYHDGVAGTTRTFKIDKLDAQTTGGSLSIDLAALIGQAPLNVKGTLGAPALLAGGAPYPLDLVLSSGNASASVKGAIGDVTKMKGLAVDVTAKGNSLADLSGLAGSPLPKLGPYNFAGGFVNIEGGYKINKLQFTMGGSSMTGDVSLALNGKRPKVVGNLAAAKIDLKDFGVTPPPAGAGGGSGGSAAGGDGRLFSNDPLPFASLNAVDAEITFTAQQMIKAPVTMDNVKLVLSLAAGRLQIKPFTAGIAGGTLNLAATIDGGKNPAPVAFDIVSNQIEAGSLMQVLAGSSVLSGGRVNMKMAVTGAGNSVRAIMAGLSGKLDATMGAGNINNGFAKLMLADLFKLLSFGGGGDSSNLKCVVIRYDINRGLATTRQLAVETSGATIIGKGTINLATEGLDMHLVPYATSANLTNLAIPMMVGGTMANPSVAPDPVAMATGTLNTVIGVPASALGALGSVVGIGGNTNTTSADTSSGCGSSAAAAKPANTKPATGGTTTGGGSTGGGGILPDVGGALKSILP